jgi:hypothetical protein
MASIVFRKFFFLDVRKKNLLNEKGISTFICIKHHEGLQVIRRLAAVRLAKWFPMAIKVAPLTIL